MGDGSACFEVNMLVKSDGSRASSLVSELEGYVVWGSTPKLIFPPFYLKKKVWRYFRKWSKKRRPPSFPIGNKIDITYILCCEIFPRLKGIRGLILQPRVSEDRRKKSRRCASSSKYFIYSWEKSAYLFPHFLENVGHLTVSCFSLFFVKRQMLF